MDQYFLRAVKMAQSFAWVFLQQPSQQTLDFLGKKGVAGEGKFLIEDSLVDLLVVEAVIGRNSKHELIQQCSQAVVIQSEGMPSSESRKTYFKSISGAMYSGLPQNE